jgi:uncharacterized metal-binding protein YceD (DUF177 family)
MAENLKQAVGPEFSRPLVVETVKIGKSDQKLSATPDECARLAERFELLALDHLSAVIHLGRKGQGSSTRVSVSGHLKAQVTQACVITLDPVRSDIEVNFDTVFDSSTEDELQDNDVDLEFNNLAEPIVDGTIDLGELIAQILAVELDPFPKKESADSSEMTLESADSSTNPFAVLEKLKNRPN